MMFVWLLVWLLGATPLIYLGGRVLKGRPAQWLALIAMLGAWVPFAFVARELEASVSATFTLGAVTLRFDGLSLLLTALTLTLGSVVVLFSARYIAGESGEEKYYALLVAMIAVMIGLSAANDLFNLWLWFEAMAVASYMLVAFHRERPASLEAGVKYLVQSATGSVLVLIAIALVFMQTGALSLDEIRAAVSGNHTGFPLAVAGALFVIGFGVKAALVPLHTWLPDAHAQAPSGISAMLSGVVIEAGLIALLRALSPFFGEAANFGILLMSFGAVNMFVGNLLALRQTQVKRLLAFSSIAQVGYMLLGLGISFYDGQGAGAQGAFFHLVNHGLMKGLAFLAAGTLIYALGQAQDLPLQISDLTGAARRYPLVAFALSVAVLGLGGLPPLAGFMSKWQILVSGVDAHNLIIDALVVFAALNSVLSLVYYAPLVNAVYRQAPSPAVQRGIPLPFTMRVPLALLALVVVAIGVYPSLLNWLTQPASAALMAAIGK